MGLKIKPRDENQAFQSNKITQYFQSNKDTIYLKKKNSIQITKT